jgi:LPS O-antigen subunit length determinant protein (WzzB/FepE family)
MTPANVSEDDEIDLRQLFHTLWLQRKVIGQFVLACALIGILIAQMSTKYVSEGVLQTGQINASNYKRYESVLLTGANLEKFLALNKQANKETAELVTGLSLSAARLKDAIKPEFAFTDKDQKLLGVKSSASDGGAMIGLRLSFEHSEPTLGAPVLLLGDYVRDTLLRVDLEGAVNSECLSNQTVAQSLRIAQIKDEFSTKQELARAKTLRGLNGKGGEVRQLVSLDKGGERFLSPQAQLNAVEITISELQLAQINRERDLKSSALRQAYFCEAVKVLQKPVNTDVVLEDMKAIQDVVFKDQDKTVPIIEQTGSELNLQRLGWENTYLRGMRFVSSPEGSEVKTRKPGRATGLLLGALLGGLMGIVFVFIRQWWRANKAEITAA